MNSKLVISQYIGDYARHKIVDIRPALPKTLGVNLTG
jgi:hypothetical protein